MANYEMIMTLEDEVLNQKGREYTSALANAMRNTREQLLGSIFEDAYGKWALNMVQLVYVRRGRYEIWKFNKRVAKKIKHRREALAMIKLMQATEE